jgi:hypothetical protein
MLSNIGKGISNAAESVSKEAGKLTTAAEKKWAEFNTSPLLESFRTGNVIQLVSRSTGKTLEVVKDNQGQHVLDGLGPDGSATDYVFSTAANAVLPDCPFGHANWVCINEGSHVVHLHNNNNFIAIKDGKTILVHCEPASVGPETRLKVKDLDKTFVSLMSANEHGQHVGVLPTGEMKPAIATGSENDGQFGVRIIYETEKETTAEKIEKEK